MTDEELITAINLMMGEEYDDDLVTAYITQARNECTNWEYQLIDVPDDLDTTKYDELVIDAVIFALSIRGAEGETQHSENGILRGFKWSDMRDYIHSHLTPYSRLA